MRCDAVIYQKTSHDKISEQQDELSWKGKGLSGFLDHWLCDFMIQSHINQVRVKKMVPFQNAWPGSWGHLFL